MANTFSREQLVLLYQLQTRDQKLLAIYQKIQDIPRAIAQLESEVVKSEEDRAVKSEELAGVEREQRAKNAELEMNAVQREEYKEKQRGITSNEAYTALERQLEFLDLADGEAEDAILELMVKSDKLKAELADLEADVDRERAKLTAEATELEQQLKDLEAERATQLKQRKEFLPEIEEDLRKEYQRWMKAKSANLSGAALAKAGFVALSRDGICESCRLAIQPQTLKEAREFKKKVYCSSCKRLLYVEPTTPDTAFP